MPTLKQYQAAADRAARKLGVTDPVVVRWQGGECRIRNKRTGAHCHVAPGYGQARGTICIRRGLTGAMSWMAHEVAHLVSRAHGSKGFLRAVATVLPKSAEARMARRIGAIPHRHQWRSVGGWATSAGPGVVTIREACDACGESRTALYQRVR